MFFLKLVSREFVIHTYYYLPGHVGKLKKPGAQASHLSLMILALQLHTPLSSHMIPVDPSTLQLQAEN